MTWKRMVTPSEEKFTEQNIQYCQEFLNYIATIDPHRLTFFDEAGVKLPDVANPRYGHSLVGTRCVEITKNAQSPNVTLNLLRGRHRMRSCLLPSYSSAFNPTELVFNKLKTILKRIEYRELLKDNLHVAVCESLKHITPPDMRGFYEYTGYIHFVQLIKFC